MSDVFGTSEVSGTVVQHVVQQLALFGEHIVGTAWDVFLLSLQDPLAPVGTIIGYIYLLSSLAAALVIYVFWARKKAKTLNLRDAFYFAFPKHVWKHSFAWLDVRYFPVQQITSALTASPIALFVGFYSARLTEYVLVHIFSIPLSPLSQPGVLVLFFMGLVSFLIYDFLFFFVHRCLHAIPFLWEFHKIHHSAPVMHPLTVFRKHFVEDIFQLLAPALIFPACVKLVAILWGYTVSTPTVLGVSLFTFVFSIVIANLQHSHVWLVLKPYWLGYFIVTPAHHQIHHSKAKKHLDRNFGGSIALWDWLFGTLYLPREREKLVFGLADHSEVEYNTIWRMLWLPLAKAFKFLPSTQNSPPLDSPQNHTVG